MSNKLSALSAQSNPETIDYRTKAYCGAALAAGVSILALAAPSEASVVVTKTHQTIPVNGQISIDLNKDGVTDFNIKMSNYFDFSFRDSVRVHPMAGGGVVGYNGGIGPYASALAAGANIGPSDHFRVGTYGVVVERSIGKETNSTHTTRTLYGKWGGDPQNRYVGVKFQIHGQTHYGWIRMTVNTDFPAGMSATITAYAYETVANKAIKAGSSKSTAENVAKVTENLPKPVTASLGMLALGSEGMHLWRREELSDL